MRSELDPAARADLERALGPGERVLWAARHDWRATLRRSLRVLAWIAAAFAALGVVGYLGLRRPDQSNAAATVIISATLGGAWLLVAALVLATSLWTRRRLYAITDAAAIVIRCSPSSGTGRAAATSPSARTRTAPATWCWPPAR
jgi:hypothetical protein